MRRILYIILPIVILIIALAIVFFKYANNRIEISISPRVCFQNNCFDVELADTDAKRTQGLMFRENLPQNQGMLFIFETPGQYSFWMKNTLIPLDIIWIDKDRKVIHISKNTPPCVDASCPSVGPQKPALFVLELNAGITERIGLKIGDQLIIKR